MRMPSLKSMLLNDSFRFLMGFLGFHDNGIYRYSVVFYVDICVFNPLNPGSDQYLISPYNNTAESFIKIMRIRQMITNLRSFDCQTNSPCQYQRNCTEKSMENIDTDVRV